MCAKALFARGGTGGLRARTSDFTTPRLPHEAFRAVSPLSGRRQVIVDHWFATFASLSNWALSKFLIAHLGQQVPIDCGPS